jgi:hypothetical protein
MRHALAPEHREFFSKNQQIEFESLLSETQIATLEKKLTIRSEKQMRLLPSHFHEIASELFKRKPLRIGSSLFSPKGTLLPVKKEKLTLKEMVSLTFLAGGALINLKEGKTLFFGPDLPLDLSTLSGTFLIAYAEERSCYSPQSYDPDPYFLKREGYVVGERLSERTHPFVIR